MALTNKTDTAGKFAITDIETKKAISKVDKQIKSSKDPLKYMDNLSKAKIDHLSEGEFIFDEQNLNLCIRKGKKIYKLTATELS